MLDAATNFVLEVVLGIAVLLSVHSLGVHALRILNVTIHGRVVTVVSALSLKL